MAISFLSSGNDSLHNKERPDPRRAAFEALYARDSRQLWALAYAACTDSDAAMECVQQAFLDLWGQAEQPADPGAWLRTRVRAAALQLPSPEPGQVRTPASDEAPVAYAQLAAQLETLQIQDRELLTLRYALDMTTEEIAELLGMNATVVHMQLSRIRQKVATGLRGESTPADGASAA